MTLGELIATLESGRRQLSLLQSDATREVKIVVTDADGSGLYSLGIDYLGQVQEWTELPDGRRQLQYKLAIVTEPLK